MVESLSTPHPSDRRGYARIVVVLAPRQIGKTTSELDVILARMRRHSGYRAAYTAQTGSSVTERFTEPDGWCDVVEGSGLAHMRTRRSAGSERIEYRRPGRRPSFVHAFPPLPSSLRGKPRDLVVVDEAQELDDVLPELLAGVMPAGDTRGTRAQLVVSGTAGAGPGPWLDLVERGRAGELVLVELGTWPDDADADDETTWSAHHPGVRAGLTSLDALRSARAALGPDLFAREYGNRWGTSGGAALPIPLDLWHAIRRDEVLVDDSTVALAFDVTPERDGFTLAGVTASGRIEVLARGHVDGIVTALRDVAPKRTRIPVRAHPHQSSAVDRLRRAGYPARCLTAVEYRAACQMLRDRVESGEVWHTGDPLLDHAVESAGRSWHGDSWVLSARRSGADVTPLVAGAIAVYAAATLRRPRATGASHTAG